MSNEPTKFGSVYKRKRTKMKWIKKKKIQENRLAWGEGVC